MLRLEDLLLANLIVRRSFASPVEVQQALVALDRTPTRGDLIAALAARGGTMALPAAREQAIAGVRRFVVQRAEQLMAVRLRQSGVLPPPALDELVARQRVEGHAWTLCDRLTHEGRLDPARRAAVEAEAARDLEAYGAQLIARHRASHFAETVALPAAGTPNVATSSEVLRALAPEEATAAAEQTLRIPPPTHPSNHAVATHTLPGHPSSHAVATHTLPGHPSSHAVATHAPPAHPSSQAVATGDDAGEVTLKIPPPPAHLLRAARPLEVAKPPSSPEIVMPTSDEMNARTIKLPAGGMTGERRGGDGADLGQTVAFPAPPPARPDVSAPVDATVRLGDAKPTPPPKKKPGLLEPGQVLAGKLEVVDELGRGGMGVVYRARSRPHGGKEVALKVVPSTGDATKEVLPRFKREILTASRVHHENVCEILDHGDAQGLAYMAMELVEGESLRDLIERDAPLPVDRAVMLLEQILRGVQGCHDAKVIHRDLKPDNVRIRSVGGRLWAKIVDFGIARLGEQEATETEDVFVTMKGVLSGTPSYVAPELIMDDELVSAGADVYAVGVIFYEMLTGKLPFPAKTLREILKETVETPPTPLAEALPNHTVPPAIERVLFRMLEKDPLVRYKTPKEVLTALAEAKKPPAPKSGFTARLVKRITSLFGKA